MSKEVEIVTGPQNRLLVAPWENAHSKMIVTIAPQFRDRSGNWRLAHSGLMFAPDVARELAPLLVDMADDIERKAREGEA